MKENIIFVNKLNAIELLRTTTVNRGNQTDVYRFFSEDELLDYVMAKRAIYVPGKLINGDEVTGTILLSMSQQLEYEDAQNLKNAFEQYEQCIINDVVQSMKETLSDDFIDKKNILIQTYQAYQTYKRNNHLYDKFDVIRLLLSLSWATKFDEIIVFNEFPLTQTQHLLLSCVFNKVKVEYIENFIKTSPSNIVEVIQAYGAVNEIAATFNKIHDAHLPLGQCQIVLINNDYIYHIINKLNNLSLLTNKTPEVTFRQGYPLLLTKPGQMLLTIKKLALGLYGVDGYEYLFESAEFNRNLIKQDHNDKWWSYFKKYVGWLRLSFEEISEITANYQEVGMKEALENFYIDIKQGIPNFIKKYCLVSNNGLDSSAINTIENTFALLEKYHLSNAKIIDLLLKKKVNPTLSAPNALHITSLENAFESNRPYTFIVGLSSDYPGQATESSLIFDNEFAKIDASNYFTSENIVRRKEQLLKDFLRVSGNTYLTFPSYRLVDQKDVNPSTIISEINSQIKQFSFDDDKLSRLYKLINDYRQNCVIENRLPLVNKPSYDPSKLMNIKFSPSQIATYFFGNKLVFVLNVLFGLNINDESDPFDIISAQDKGTLLHAALENYQDGDDKDRVRKKTIALFRNFMKQKPSVLRQNVASIEADFIRGLDVLLGMSLGIEAECEKYYEGTINGLRFGGVADRIAKVGNKNVLIDYKTGGHSKHDVNEPETFIQGLIYAQLITSNNPKWKQIDEIWFIYPYEAENKRIAKMAFDEQAKIVLNKCVDEIKQLLLVGDLRALRSNELEEDETRFTDQYYFLFSLYGWLIKQGGSDDGVE